MTKQEILERVTMRQVLTDRGLTINHNSMCSCPFHGKDRKPSMKVFKDGFNCFTCGANGNVIDFVMRYDNVDFKSAFVLLGGTYKIQTDKERKEAERKREREKVARERKAAAEADFKNRLSFAIALTRKACETFEPTTDEWCFFTNKLPQLLYIWQLKYEEGTEVDEIDVLRICREIRQKLDSICRVDG